MKPLIVNSSAPSIVTGLSIVHALVNLISSASSMYSVPDSISS